MSQWEPGSLEILNHFVLRIYLANDLTVAISIITPTTKRIAIIAPPVSVLANTAVIKAAAISNTDSNDRLNSFFFM